MMKFTVITVSFNAGAALKETLQTIKQQTYEDYEVLIKDAGSTDGSLKGIPEDPRFRLISEPDKGIYDGMNRAIREAAGDYLIFMNCGDGFHDETVLLKTAAALEGKKGPVIAYGDSFSLLSGNVVKAPAVITEKVCYNGIPCHQAIFYAREIFTEKVFDINYKIRADYDHFLYCYFKGKAEFTYLNFTVCDYEGGGFSESKKNRDRNKAEHQEIVGKYIPTGRLFAYKARLILTLQPVREKMAKSKTFGKFYEKVKRTLKK